MEPDVTFFGFPITPAAAIGVRRQSRATTWSSRSIRPSRASVSTPPVTTALPRRRAISPIGTQPPAGVPLKGRTWGRNSAHMAEITRRLPVRIAIHASQLVALP